MKTSSTVRAALLAIPLLGALATAGCLKYEQKAVIAKDGSGTLKQNISIDLDAMGRLREFAKTMFPGAGGAEPGMDGGEKTEGDDALLPYNLNDLQERAKQVKGLQIRNAKAEHRYNMDFDAAFTEWSSLGEANLFPGSADLEKNADGTYTFTLDMMAGQGPKPGEAPPDPGAGGMDPSMIMAFLEPMVGSLEFKQSLTLPGAIVETNGTKSEDGLSVTWKVGFKDLTANKGANIMKVKFKGDGLELKPFHFAPDVQDILARVQGKKPKGAPVVTPSGGDKGSPKEGSPKEPAMGAEPAMDGAK